MYINGVLPSHKNEVMPFAATWMDLEIVILTGQSETHKYHITYIQYVFFNVTNDLIYKTETDSQT